MSSNMFLHDLSNASLDDFDNATEAIRRHLNFELFPYRPLSPPPFVLNPNAPLPEFQCDQMYPGFESDDPVFDSHPHLSPSSLSLPLVGDSQVNPGHEYPYDPPLSESSFEYSPLGVHLSYSEWSRPVSPLTAEPLLWKSFEDAAYSVSAPPATAEEAKETKASGVDLLGGSPGVGSIKYTFIQHSSPSIPSGSALSTPALTDSSASSSRSSSLAPPRASRKRSRPTDPTPDAAQPISKTDTGGYKCRWRQFFGGNCTQVCALKQQHDRHILTHLPDRDGAVLKLFKCITCMFEKTQGRADKKGRKTAASFPRKDPCIRHVKDQHTNGQRFVIKDYIEEVERSWWWPDDLFLTPVFKGGAAKPPEGETRTWREYILDVIREYPDVVNKPRKKKGKEEDEEMDEEMNEDDYEPEEPTRASKRRKIV